MTDYLKKMPFTIAFIDKRGNSYEDSSRDLNAYISRHPPMIKRLHQPKLAYQILRMAAHHCGMQVVRRPADSRQLMSNDIGINHRGAMCRKAAGGGALAAADAARQPDDIAAHLQTRASAFGMISAATP